MIIHQRIQYTLPIGTKPVKCMVLLPPGSVVQSYPEGQIKDAIGTSRRQREGVFRGNGIPRRKMTYSFWLRSRITIPDHVKLEDGAYLENSNMIDIFPTPFEQEKP